MSEQKKFSVGPALLAFGIGGAFAGGCMAGLAYLMARQGSRKPPRGPWQALQSVRAVCSADGWRPFSSAAGDCSAAQYKASCSSCC